jgi:hypothetical protein
MWKVFKTKGFSSFWSWRDHKKEISETNSIIKKFEEKKSILQYTQLWKPNQKGLKFLTKKHYKL